MNPHGWLRYAAAHDRSTRSAFLDVGSGWSAAHGQNASGQDQRRAVSDWLSNSDAEDGLWVDEAGPSDEVTRRRKQPAADCLALLVLLDTSWRRGLHQLAMCLLLSGFVPARMRLHQLPEPALLRTSGYFVRSTGCGPAGRLPFRARGAAVDRRSPGGAMTPRATPGAVALAVVTPGKPNSRQVLLRVSRQLKWRDLDGHLWANPERRR